MDEPPQDAEPAPSVATAELAPPPLAPRPRLRRRAEDRVVAGVAGGLADRFGWPVGLLRVVFGAGAFVWATLVYQAVFGAHIESGLGSGVAFLASVAGFSAVVYVVLWIAVPREDLPASALQRAGRQAVRPLPVLRSWAGLALLVAGGVVLADQLGIWQPNVGLAVGLIVAGVLLYRQEARVEEAPRPARLVEPGAAEAPEPYVPRVPREPRDRSPLGWLTLGVAALAVGGVAIASSVGDLELRLVVYPSIALVVLALGLLVGTMIGRARWLIAPALLLVPVVFLSSVVAVPLEGGWGRLVVEPDSMSEVPSAPVRRIGGDVYVDLQWLQGETGRVEIEASSGFGQVIVVVPFDAHVVATGRAGLGEIGFGSVATALGLDRTLSRTWEPRRGDGATIVLDLEIGIGSIEIYRLQPTRRQVRELEREEEAAA